MAGCDASEDADLDRGRALFLPKCGTCHTLAQAGSGADIGPDLDASFAQARADGMDNDTIEGVVQQQIANPRAVEEGVPNYTRIFMPADLVTGQDAEDVAAYVASVAGVPGAKPPELPPDQLFTERCGSCHALQRGGHHRRPPARTSTRCSPARTRATSSSRSSIRTPRSPRASARRDAAGLRHLADPEDLQGLVDYLLDNTGK